MKCEWCFEEVEELKKYKGDLCTELVCEDCHSEQLDDDYLMRTNEDLESEAIVEHYERLRDNL
jgi:hypothetical protein